MQAGRRQRDRFDINRYPERMDIVLWSIIGVLTLCTGIAALAAIISLAGSKYRG